MFLRGSLRSGSTTFADTAPTNLERRVGTSSATLSGSKSCIRQRIAALDVPLMAAAMHGLLLEDLRLPTLLARRANALASTLTWIINRWR